MTFPFPTGLLLTERLVTEGEKRRPVAPIGNTNRLPPTEGDACLQCSIARQSSRRSPALIANINASRWIALTCGLGFVFATVARPQGTSNSNISAANIQTAKQGVPVGPTAKSSIDPPQLISDDGQLISHEFTIFITYLLTSENQPLLHFSGSHLLSAKVGLELQPIPPTLVAPHQYRLVTVGNTTVPAEGTLLTFDLSGFKYPIYKAAIRLRPRIEWTEGPNSPGQPAVQRQILATDDVYLGNLAIAAVWTALTILLVGITAIMWSIQKAKQVTKFKPRPWLLLITGSDGYLSLWRTQLLLWTVAVGGVVFMYGLLRLHVPDIPETLVTLMGMSLLTGSVSATKSRQDTVAKIAQQNQNPPDQVVPAVAAAAPDPAVAAPPAPPQVIIMNPSVARFADLISNWNVHTGQLELSIPKAQMVFWTVIILGLFVVKSFLLGALWPVPWAMVALTGFSQAGYIGDKYIQSISAPDQ